MAQTRIDQFYKVISNKKPENVKYKKSSNIRSSVINYKIVEGLMRAITRYWRCAVTNKIYSI